MTACRLHFLWKGIMAWTNEIIEDLRKSVLEAHGAGKGYQNISKEFGLHQTTIRQIVYKWRKFKSTFTLPRSGWPTNIKSFFLLSIYVFPLTIDSSYRVNYWTTDRWAQQFLSQHTSCDIWWHSPYNPAPVNQVSAQNENSISVPATGSDNGRKTNDVARQLPTNQTSSCL